MLLSISRCFNEQIGLRMLIAGCYTSDDQGSLVLALRKLQWAKDTPRWVTTNTTSKKGLKGRLVVAVAVVGFGLIRE